MPSISLKSLARSALILLSMSLVSCRETQVVSLTKDPGYNAKDMRRVLVIAVVRKPATQRLLEDAFVENLKKRHSEAVASYTLVREGEVIDEAGWKRLVADNHFDAVIVSRLIDLNVVEKDVDPKYITGPSSNATGYGYYSSSYRVVYQPGFTLREETAVIETRVYDAAGDKQVWSAHSKTNIVQGRDPEAQVRDFVHHMMKKIYG